MISFLEESKPWFKELTNSDMNSELTDNEIKLVVFKQNRPSNRLESADSIPIPIDSNTTIIKLQQI